MKLPAAILILGVLLTFSTQAQWVINDVSYDATGQSEIVWTDDGSYGIQMFNKADDNGNIKVMEYAKVSDSNFTRDSFRLNTAYTFEPLTSALVANGVVSHATIDGNSYEDGLTSGGVLNPGTGWILVDYGDGTHGVEHSGRNHRVPVLGNYAVRETAILASLLTDGHLVDGVLLNADNQPYLQIVFQTNATWNLSSYDASGNVRESTGVNSQGLGVGAITQTTNGTSIVWLIDHGMPDEMADPDNDGFQTLEEYICGTDPTNGLSFFQIDLASNILAFATASNRLYDVESCYSLIASPSGLPTSNAWKNVTNNLPGSGSSIAFPVSPTHPSAFCRVNVRLP